MEFSIHDYIEALSRYGKGLSVLYAEDEVNIAAQVEGFLRKFFEDVRTASDGLQAWQAYEERPCDILVTDVMMPNMSGIELCEKITEVNPHQKIVVVSAHNESEYLMKLINMGVDKFLLKPFDNKRFLRALYSVSNDLYEHSERLRLQEELKANLETTQLILDMMDDALVIVQEGVVVRANLRFLQLAGAESAEAFNGMGGRIDMLFVRAKGYIGHCSNNELLELLQKDPMQKALVKDTEGAMVMLLRQKQISDVSTIVMLTDVTTMEKDILVHRQKLLTNPFTGIPNKVAFVEKLQEAVQQAECSVVLVTVVEYAQMIKWHGKESALEVERLLSSSIKMLLENRNFIKSVYFANYDKNRFVLMADQKTAAVLADAIEERELTYSYRRDEKDEAHNVKLRARTKIVSFAKETQIKDAVDVIEQKFEQLSIE